MRYLILLPFILSTFTLLAQKKIVDPQDLDHWRSLNNTQISGDGKWISYEIKPNKGDSWLYLYHVDTEKLDSFPRGGQAVFSHGSRFLAFTISPPSDSIRKLELAKVDKKKWPADSLGIYLLDRDSLLRIPKIKSFKVAEKADYLAYLSTENKLGGSIEKKKKKGKKKEKNEEIKSDGGILSVLDASMESKHASVNVKEYQWSDNGKYLAFVTHEKEKIDSFRVHLFQTDNGFLASKKSQHTDIQKLSFDQEGKQFVYLYSNDSSKVKHYRLSLSSSESFQERLAFGGDDERIPSSKMISPHRAPQFTKDCQLLYFGVCDTLNRFEKDTLTDSEKVKLDLWHYNDERLMTVQLSKLETDIKKSDLWAIRTADLTTILLAKDSIDIQVEKDLRGPWLLGSVSRQYNRANQWEFSGKRDYYRISTIDGRTELLLKAHGSSISLAPSGNYLAYFNPADLNYYLSDLSNERTECMTCTGSENKWLHDLNGMPADPEPYGIIGWSADEAGIYLQAALDLWVYNHHTKSLSPLGKKHGTQNQIEIRPHFFTRDSVYFYADQILYKGFDKKSKGTHLFGLTEENEYHKLAYFDADVNTIQRSENKSQYLFRKMSFQAYPEVFVPKGSWQEAKAISTTNPQQALYNWGTVELINWKTYKVKELEGLLYKPEDFDPAKSYPMIIYYYELYTDRMHQYYTPKPTASVIFPSEYTSGGYVVFIPDIRYETGRPAASAYDCIMSGTDAVLKAYPNIDSTRMGLQGQSWGGYQTAQLITMTTRFRAAMAGAPVSNMFSAYGGIRWGSGMNRQFQYEKSQSRIGATIWERPDLYTENSPLFHLPKVNTPLLIMHNDQDDAVPWYQGIELFTAMVRLNKKAWLLNYNGDKHNLMQDANRRDLSIRMRQFFDYYLMDKPAPRWLLDGIPATEKGKELRYEYVEE